MPFLWLKGNEVICDKFVPCASGEGLESEPYRMFNLDVFEYLQDSPFGLYGSIPFMTAHKAGSTTGVFW